MSLEALGKVAGWKLKPNLTGAAFRLANYANPETGQCNPSNATLAKALDTTERTVQTLIAELIEVGVIDRIATFKDGRQTSNNYRFFWGGGEAGFVGEGEAGFVPGGEAGFVQKQKEETERKNTTAAESAKRVSSPQDHGFEEFWSSYPRKVAKPAAAKSWRKLPTKDRLAIMGHLASAPFAEKETQYTPHPSTYLNQRRWEDQDTNDQPSPQTIWS